MPTKRKADGPLGASSKAYRQGKLFSFFRQQPQEKPNLDAAASAIDPTKNATTVSALVKSLPLATKAVKTAIPLQATQSQTEQDTVDPTATSNSGVIAKLQHGDCIQVYWPDDQEYYAAKIVKQEAGSARFFIKYDDGQEEWIDLASATFRISDAANATKPNKKKRGHIQESDDEEEENGFVMSDSEDEGSVYQDEKQANGDNDDDDDDQWLVSDEENDEKRASVRPKKLKVVAHKTPARSSFEASSFQSIQKALKPSTAALTPKQITPVATQSSNKKSTPGSILAHSNSSSFQSPTISSHNNIGKTCAATLSTGAPPMYQREVVNPPGSHVHNHLTFLQYAHRRDAQNRPTSHPEYDPRTLKVDKIELEKHCGKLTDGVQQWWDLKAQYFDAVLLFKTGKFYELFHMDADVGVQICGHSYMKGHVAHSGFPEAAYGKFADMMVRAGYKVCRVEQTETPDQLKERKKKHKGKGSPKVVNREVCSILTAGTRTYCVLDRIDDTADASSAGVGPLLAIREVLLDLPSSQDETEVQPVCEYGITLVDAVRGIVTVGQFADDVLRSRMDTLLLTFQPSEIILQGGNDGASQSLRALIHSSQQTSATKFRVEYVLGNETFPRSNAIDPEMRRQLERRGTVHPWDVQETLDEIHRRGYYPRASKKGEVGCSVSRWPTILQAVVEGSAELAISSFGAALFYLQRNLIDMEILSMGHVKAYVPPASSVAHENSARSMGMLAAQEILEDDEVIASSRSLSAPSRRNHESEEMDIDAPFHYNEEDVSNMALDGTTLMNLEILANNADNKQNGSLWSLLNHTKTPHGNRLLRAWLLRPLFRRADIERRTDAVQELVSGSAAVALSEAAAILSKCGDIERLLSRVHSMGVIPGDGAGNDDTSVSVHPNERAVLYETATYTRRMVSDFSSLLNGLREIDRIPEAFAGIEIRSGLLNKIVKRKDQGGSFPDMTDTLDWFYENFDCGKARQGQFEPAKGIDGDFDAACDAIDCILDNLEQYKNGMCAQFLSPASLARSSWKYINIKPDSKDKYLIELPSNVVVPVDFIVKGKRGTGAKQVIKYRSSAVEKLVQELDLAYDVQDQRRAIGMKLIFSKFDSMRNLWAAAGQATALLDALGSLAKASSSPGYCRASILDCPRGSTSSISVVQGRHPIVEKTLKTGEFVPNDVTLGTNSKRILLLSGVNMGGKSTCLRQTCLLAIMAQIGCFVPAESFELTPVDRIYTRLGASDRILMGQSTFFVELAETAAALRGATRRSLVIMDELGRGTSTFDGTAIASATVKHLVDRTKCISLFATHYHSLLDEWQCHPNVMLGHMECVVESENVTTRRDSADKSTITFLYTLGEGIFPKSFGINVARLAGLPSDVISNAARISSEFEREMKEGATANVLTGAKACEIKARFLEAMNEDDDWESKLVHLLEEVH
ncbi:hypothetical protein MPSEU_000240200 [Mayamaea pseudoterrestris]|nr:hypothetical protein MPSEU_000240200 [Mayamaea pseudoterrestris]